MSDFYKRFSVWFEVNRHNFYGNVMLLFKWGVVVWIAWIILGRFF